LSIEMALSPGTQLGPYVIESLIGTGGMGQVYRARDTRLERLVAIKRLTEGFTRFFEREARAIAALNHPNICQVYDIGPDYMVLEYLDGSPPAGPMPVNQVVALAISLADALHMAHQRGVLHRDLKPANIIVTTEGVGKLLDFGVAKLSDRSANTTAAPTVAETMIGTVVGTYAYMSPEQARGEPLDARSDIFSFGATLYELLSGTPAFPGRGAMEVVSAVLRDDPPPLAVSPALQRILERCLAKDPRDRFQTMVEVKAALETLTGEPVDAMPSVAVLAFANLSADPENEYFADGLSEEIINALAQVPGVKVIARTSAFAFKGKNEDVRRIARTLGVNHVLEGSVRRAGGRVRVTAQLISAADGSHLWSDRYDRPLTDVFAVQDEIALAISGELKGKFAAPPPSSAVLRSGFAEAAGARLGPAPRQYQPDLAAYDQFLKGRAHLIHFTPEAWTRAKAYFEQAIALDARYAAPVAELGLGYFISGMHGMQPMRDVAPLVRAQAERALELDPSDPRPRFLLGAISLAQDYDWAAARDHFAASMNVPNVSADARWIYASLYLGALGRFEESTDQMRRAVEQDPLNASWRAIWAAHLIHAGRPADAIREAVRAAELEPQYFVAHQLLGESYLAAGALDEAIAAFERAHQQAPWNAMPTGLLGAAVWMAGDHARSAALLVEMQAPMPLWGRVWYHLYKGEMDEAADWYERVIGERDPFALVYAAAPQLAPLRAHHRWPAIARVMNLSHG
jgi:TolB-like protein/predicted Ser/Thr protein kinase